MKTAKLALLGVLVLALGATACGNDNGGPLPPENPDASSSPDASLNCPTGLDNFASLYATIWNGRVCNTTLGCHGNEPSGGFQVAGTTPAMALAALLGATADPAAAGMYPKRVVPGMPEQSYLWNKISTASPVSGSMMPLGGMLTDCQIQDIKTWIQNGAMNN
jgi:hypothetical protein